MYSHCTVIYPWFLCFMDPPIPVWNGGFINHLDITQFLCYMNTVTALYFTSIM